MPLGTPTVASAYLYSWSHKAIKRKIHSSSALGHTDCSDCVTSDSSGDIDEFALCLLMAEPATIHYSIQKVMQSLSAALVTSRSWPSSFSLISSRFDLRIPKARLATNVGPRDTDNPKADGYGPCRSFSSSKAARRFPITESGVYLCVCPWFSNAY